jgi:hypothetical protein
LSACVAAPGLSASKVPERARDAVERGGPGGWQVCAAPDAPHVRLAGDVIASRRTTVADNEPVYAPDQLKPSNRKWGRIGAVGSALALLTMVQGNHEGNIEKIFLVVTALLLLTVVGLDAVLRRSGLR